MFSALSKKQHALITSWCLKKENKLLGVLSPSAFLVEIGKVLIAQQIMADGKVEEFQQAMEELQNVEEAEKKIVGVTTPEVSATIFRQWKFEDGLVDVIGNCMNPEEAKDIDKKPAQILNVVRVAIPLDSKPTPETIAEAKKLIEKYELNMESFESAIEHF